MSLLPESGTPHRFLRGEVAFTTVARRNDPFVTPNRHVRLNREGRAVLPYAPYTGPGPTYVDIAIILYPTTRSIEFGVSYTAPARRNMEIRVRLALAPTGPPVAEPFPRDPWAGRGGLSPRLLLGNDARRGNLPTVWVDVTFFDVTQALRELQTTLETRAQAATDDMRRRLERHAFLLKPLKQEFTLRGGTVRTDVSGSEQIDTRVLEYTGGTPLGWVVCVPRLYPERLDRFGIFLFYRPVIDRYSFPEDMDLERVFRYYRVPPVGYPWFIGPQPEPGPSDTVMPPMVALPNPCGWLRQLAHAQAVLSPRGPGTHNAPICVNPIPNGGSFGHSGSFASLRHLLRSILRTLADEGVIGRRVRVVEPPYRVAISGFSAGGRPLFSVLRDFQSSRHVAGDIQVDEVYCFDPSGFNDHKQTLTTWFNANPDRRLRLFAGDNQASMRDLLAGLRGAGGGRAWLRPSSPRFWSDRLYRDALSIPLHTRPGRSPYQQFREDPPDGFAPTNILVEGARHQWAVGGGEGSSLRDERFSGHLELALLDSGF